MDMSLAEALKRSERIASDAEAERVRSTRRLCGYLPVEWVSAFLLPIPLIAFLINVVFFPVVFIRSRRWTRCVLLGTSPVTFIVGPAIASYFGGAPQLRFIGHPGTKSFNVDPTTRCEWSGGGCIRIGNEWLINDVHNLAIQAMVHILGLPRGAYTGDYPTQDDARLVVRSGQIVSWSDLRRDVIKLRETDIRLHPGVGAALIQQAISGNEQDEQTLTVRAAIWKHDCLVLRVPIDTDRPDSAMIVLVSRANGRPFAYYEDGDYHHSYPPVLWTPRPPLRPV